MSLCLLKIGDGRDDIHERCDRSLKKHLPRFDHVIVVDDREHELGFGGAIAKGWEDVLDTGDAWCFWVEMDYLFNRPVDVAAMRRVLEEHPYLVQMALLRQPWNDQERLAGGIVQMHPTDYIARVWNGQTWLEHSRHFTTNPCLVPTWIMRGGWPQCDQSEGHFGINLFGSDPKLRAGYWGSGEEWVTHIGTRVGHGY